MATPGYDLIATVIKKQEHKAKYGRHAANPYDLALTFALERLLPLLEEEGQTEVYLIAEGRGKREDDELRLSFLHTVTYGLILSPLPDSKKSISICILSPSQ